MQTVAVETDDSGRKRLNGFSCPQGMGAIIVTEGDALNKLVFIVTGRAIMTGENIAGDDPRECYEKLESPGTYVGTLKTQPYRTILPLFLRLHIVRLCNLVRRTSTS